MLSLPSLTSLLFAPTLSWLVGRPLLILSVFFWHFEQHASALLLLLPSRNSRVNVASVGGLRLHELLLVLCRLKCLLVGIEFLADKLK